MKAHIEAMRGLVYLNAESIDLSKHATDESVRQARSELADLLTPISKGWSTDVGCELASIAVQVHGGMGFVEETGVAQHYRDIRIAPIYEGTNGIQAIDLVGRKLPMRGGAVDRRLPRRDRGHGGGGGRGRRRAGGDRGAAAGRRRAAARGDDVAVDQRP